MTERGQEAEGTFALAIDSEAFCKAAQLFERWIPQNQLTAQAALWLDRGDLVVRIGSDEARVPAAGSSPGTVTLPAGFLTAESGGLPDSGEIHLSIDGNRLRLRMPGGSKSTPCEIATDPPEWPEFIEQLTPFTMLELLLLPQRYSAASIEHSGLADEVSGAASSLRDLVDHLDDAIHEAATSLGLDAAQAQEALTFLVGPGLAQLHRRNRSDDFRKP